MYTIIIIKLAESIPYALMGVIVSPQAVILGMLANIMDICFIMSSTLKVCEGFGI